MRVQRRLYPESGSKGTRGLRRYRGYQAPNRSQRLYLEAFQEIIKKPQALGAFLFASKTNFVIPVKTGIFLILREFKINILCIFSLRDIW